MKKALLLLIFAITFSPAYSEIITGEVEYNHNLINNTDEFFTDTNNLENSKCIYGKTSEFENRIVVKFSDNTYGIKYFNNPLYSWYYSPQGKLISYTKRTKNGFPAEIVKYKPTGEMIKYGYQVSEVESFWYEPNGELYAHWLGNNCYNRNGELIMTRNRQN